jgi:ketosteroid isomerase-like protein
MIGRGDAMSLTKRFMIVLASVALLCGPSASRATGETLDEASQAFDAALKKDDAEGVFNRVTDDVVLMPPGEAPLRGKVAAREWYTGLVAQYRTSSLARTRREVFVGDRIGAVTGTHEWVLKPVAGGDPVVDRGSYMQIWKQQEDGRWLFAREIWNASAPPAVQP